MTQDEPIMDGSLDAGRDEKVRGIVEQVSYDVRLNDDDTEVLLRQRLADSAIVLDDAEIARLVRRIEESRP
jgi:hypothetical protein